MTETASKIDRHTDRSWQSFLPSAYRWLSGVTIKRTTVAEPGSCLVIPVTYDKGPDLNSTGLSKSMTDEIISQTQGLNWNGKGEFFCKTKDNPVLLIPLSKVKVSTVRLARDAGMNAGSLLRDRLFPSITLWGHSGIAASDLLDGLSQGFYSQGLFKCEADKREFPGTIYWNDPTGSDTSILEAKNTARAALFARALQDAPANWLTPAKWAQLAEEHFKGSSAKVTILGRKELENLKMGSFLSVSNGSVLEPKLISIKISGAAQNKSTQKVTLVGKGLTFDAGGISLKPAKGMEEMKYDMSGGSAVMAAAHFLADHAPCVDVHCIIGAVENLCSGTATRPGDIVQACNGKTIEVLNTDAEGRLVLADLLSYASKDKPDLIVDLATLTGAVLQGLGSSGAAILANSDQVANYIKSQGEQSGEPFWQLPLWPEIDGEVKSDIADLKNIAKANVNAGTIVGGAFLKEFVDEGIPWAHLDIAGTGWNCSAVGYPKSGGSAFAFRTLTRICRKFEL